MEPKKETSHIWIFIVVIILFIVGGFMFLGGDNAGETVVEEEASAEVVGDATAPKTTGGGNEIPPADNLTVSYTSEGFSPFILEVNAGDTVNFVNNSNATMWVTSEAHPTADQHYPEFGMSKSFDPGDTYVFQFTLTGAWGYKNLNNEKHLGAIIVAPQKQQ